MQELPHGLLPPCPTSAPRNILPPPNPTPCSRTFVLIAQTGVPNGVLLESPFACTIATPPTAGASVRGVFQRVTQAVTYFDTVGPRPPQSNMLIMHHMVYTLA